MLKKVRTIACGVACLVAFCGIAQAQEDIEATINAAMPHMHHSCASILETYPDDEEAVVQIVREMAYVSLYNRQIDVLALVPDEAERDGLRDEFTEELEDACDDDPGRLLAGAVDEAIKTTMAPFH